MTGWRRPSTASPKPHFVRHALTAAALVVSSVALIAPAPAGAAPLNLRIDLKVLVLDDGSGPVAAIKSQMDAEGVPFNSVNIVSASITPQFLTTANQIANATEAKYQAVVVPDNELQQLSVGERTTLRAFEARFGVRQVNAWDNNINVYAGIGLNTPTFDGILDGTTAQVTANGRAAGFGYLNGPVPFSIGSFGHIAQPLSAAYTSLVDASPPGGGTSGSILGVYSSGGVEQMVITPGFAFTFLQFKYLGHGIITWMTRGVHFGYNRNNFTFHFDDAFGTDALWDPALNCTPGEDCLIGTDPPGARMAPSDVTSAVQWMQANNYKITLPFNTFYAYEDGPDPDSNPDPDPLADALLANKASFLWLNHGFQHIYQGCIQDFTVTPWVCTTFNGSPWVLQADIESEILDNIAKGQQLGLTGLFDPTEYLSGEHSGLQYSSATPGQTQTDNPNFTAALAHLGIAAIGADASRETGSRVVGTANTIPRHPTALYYNTATRAQAVDEYNWFYTTLADGGSGTCGTDPNIPPCIHPLLTDAGFDEYIVPTDAAFDLGFILSNDPRPFYAHVSNLVGGQQALAYPLLEKILGTLRTVFTAATGVVNLTLTEAADQLVRQQRWAIDSAAVSGYVQNGAISITNGTGGAVPFTAPVGSTIVGTTFESYGGESSAWLTAGPKTGALPAPALVTTGGTFLVGQSGIMTVSVSSTPTATVLIGGTLPTGLTYTSTPGGITVTGTPAAGTENVYPLVTFVAAGYNTAQAVTLTVATAAAFTSASSKTVVAGTSFSFDVTTSGGLPAPTISYTGTLPSGVSFTPGANGTATLSGTPATSAGGQSFPITLTATNAAGAVDQSFTLVVNRAPQITSSAAVAAVGGTPFSFTITTTGTPVPAITKSGALPSGITFADQGNGTAELTGTAPKSEIGHSFPLTLTATSTAGVSHQSFTLTVAADASLKSITPARLADTRPGFTTVDALFAGEGRRATGSTLELLVAGRGGVPIDANAVALNVTVAEALGSGFVTVYPCGFPQPVASSLNYTAGAIVPNAVIAELGTDGKVCLFVSNATQLIVDVNGYFPVTSTFSSMNPARLLETRSGAGHTTVDGLRQGEGMRGQNTITTLDVTGRAGIPANASAVVLNVTVTEAHGPGFATVYPCGDIPTASNINYTTGSTVANMVVARVGPDGTVCLYNNEATHLVVDVNGYFPGDGSYQSINPARFLETRSGPGLVTVEGRFNGGGLLENSMVTELTVAGRDVVPNNAKTVVLNVTVTEAAAPGFITVYPCGIDIPTASNLNYGVGTTVAGAVIAQIPANGKVCLFNSGSTHLIADVNGYLLN